jgi:AbiV family abortive infection protein
MNIIKKTLMRLTYKHPSSVYKPINDDERGRLIDIIRKSIHLYRITEPKNKNKNNREKVIKLDVFKIVPIQIIVLNNAIALTKEAKWLRLRGYYARAFVLAKLAQEEYGKIYLLDSAALYYLVTAPDDLWKELWQMWRDHKMKSFMMKLPFGLEIKDYIKWTDEEEEQKLGAIYVEFDENGCFIPERKIKKPIVDRMIDICDYSEVHIKAKLRDVPLMNKNGSPGLGVDSMLQIHSDVLLGKYNTKN